MQSLRCLSQGRNSGHQVWGGCRGPSLNPGDHDTGLSQGANEGSRDVEGGWTEVKPLPSPREWQWCFLTGPVRQRSPCHSLINLLKAMVACWMFFFLGGGERFQGKVLNFGKERQEERRLVSIWESSRSCRLATAAQIFSTLFATMDSLTEMGRCNREPRRQKFNLVVGISEGRGLLELSASPGI